ncbi:MAG: methyltransferase type 12, partial [Bacteroidota bacterium]|nr:methyltransferase type 12 [Bacteroidota bacterium]
MWSTEESIKDVEQGSKAGAIQNVVNFVKEIPEFKQAKKMCDFAGNSGYYSFSFLNENKNLYASVYD